MGEMLQQTLELYSEPWKKDHDEVMAKYKAADGLGEVCAFGIFLFEGLHRKLEHDGTAHVQQVEPALRGFLGWYKSTSHVLNMAKRLKSENYDVTCDDQLAQLEDYHLQAGPIIDELADAKRAIDSVKNNKSLSLDDYIAELRNPSNG